MPPSKAHDRLAEIRARVARRAAQGEEAPLATEPPPSTGEEALPEDTALAAASAHFLGAAEQITQGRSVEGIAIGHIAPDERPEMRQPRLLPPPSDLISNGQPAPAYRALVAELLALGRSLHERQIQPIIVYPGGNAAYPAARYLILVGHRRWTAATLVGLEKLDAIVVDAPTIAERVRIQYAENEAREEFSDMERAWSLVQMKQAMEDASWEIVESQFGISRSRRHELTRLLAFSAEQQRQVALLRLQETQARPLHSGIRNGGLTPAQVDAILSRLAQLTAERAADALRPQEGSGTARRVGIDGPTVARLVARAHRSASPTATASAVPTPRWFSPLREQLERAAQGVRRTTGRATSLGHDDRKTLLSDLRDLAQSVTALVQALEESTPSNGDETSPTP